MLSWILVLVGALCLSWGILLAQASAGSVNGISPDWLGLSTLAAFGALAVEWGQRRRQTKDLEDRMRKVERVSGEIVPRGEVEQKMNRLEDKIDNRFDRIESQIDALFDRLHVERRAPDSSRRVEG